MKISAIYSLLLCLIVSAQRTHAQTNTVAARFPEIRLQISKSQYSDLLDSKGLKMELKKPQLTINGDTAAVKEINSRGNNSLTFKHKSLSIDLENSFSIKVGGEKNKIKKFDLLNLVMDKNLWHNRWAFLLQPLC